MPLNPLGGTGRWKALRVVLWNGRRASNLPDVGRIGPMEQAVLQKWDYLVEEMNSLESLRASLSRLGNEGWELVNVSRIGSGDAAGPVKTLRVRKGDAYCAVLKRPGF